MVLFMQLMEMFGVACLRVFSVLVYVVDRTTGEEFVAASSQGAAERKALHQSELEAISRLPSTARALLWFSDGHITQARAAKRKFWKVSDPMAYARLYAALNYSEEAVHHAMTVQERMPGYFRAKVRNALATLKNGTGNGNST